MTTDTAKKAKQKRADFVALLATYDSDIVAQVREAIEDSTLAHTKDADLSVEEWLEFLETVGTDAYLFAMDTDYTGYGEDRKTEWYLRHDGDAYVFVGHPKYAKVNPHEPLDPTTPTAILNRLAERAAEEEPGLELKPTNAHALRHNFVTIALRRGMDESSIKHQIGHKPGSDVMNTTYAHLKDSDHIREAREAFDLEVDDDEITADIFETIGTLAEFVEQKVNEE